MRPRYTFLPGYEDREREKCSIQVCRFGVYLNRSVVVNQRNNSTKHQYNTMMTYHFRKSLRRVLSCLLGLLWI